MFEITPDEIAQLSDEDLRTLVGRLCESELRKRGLSASAVTWGGHQNSPDGGLDVRVTLPPDASIDGFVPRKATGFQAKKESMPRQKILDEMCPSGGIRPVIRQLAEQAGAYIIVSSGDSVSETSLHSRRKAMAEAIQDLPSSDAIVLDFYDRTRLATWVRDHPGLILWIRDRIHKQIPGWRPYEAWARSPDGVTDEYIVDDGLRIQTDTQVAGGLGALEGIERIRVCLRNPGSIVRLIGLSGVGKTRLVQALFDHRVGEKSLDPTLAYYTDMSDEPDPAPTTVASNLIATGERAILIIDNSPPDLHRRLSELCRSLDSPVSLITVEYDIREDQPEGTEVFSLEPSSIDLIEKLIRRRFPHISAVDVDTVAKFSGGNARIAIALAETIDKHETIAGLSDEDLFGRLFHQRHAPSESLLAIAEVLSLVYSFQGEDILESDEAELFRLGALIGKSPEEMFRGVTELRRRQLIQRRGVWRAVLPPALANRLAARALENIPVRRIEEGIISNAPERLMKSFSRRLGYLHSSKGAQLIVRKWLEPGGKLSQPAQLDDLSQAMFNNIAPVSPELTLAALERAILECENEEMLRRCRRYLPLIRSIAYEAALFERCLELILRLIETEQSLTGENNARNIFLSLFPIRLSGTHATIEQKLAVTSSLLLSDDPVRRTLGVSALGASLQAAHFVAVQGFEFGARPRDYGYWPRSRDDAKHWFGQALQLAENVACSDQRPAADVCTLIAEQFRGLWTRAAMYDDLERVCRRITAKLFWMEGWIAVRQTTHFDSSGFTPEVSHRLASLESLLHPKDLLQRVRSLVLSDRMLGVGLDSEDDGHRDIKRILERAERMAEELGKAVAPDEKALAELLPDLTSGRGQLLWNFGRGLAEDATQPEVLWDRLINQLAATNEENRQVQVFHGFLNALNGTSSEAANKFLDSSLESHILGPYYPYLQTSVGIDERGVNRLLQSLSLGLAPIRVYRQLSAGRVTDSIPGPTFRQLVIEIAKKKAGLEVAIEVLYMRLLSCEGRNESCDPDSLGAGCELLVQVEFAKSRAGGDHQLETVSRFCLTGTNGATVVERLCTKLRSAISRFEAYVFHHDDLIRTLFRVQPISALNGLCGEDSSVGFNILDETNCLRINPFEFISENDLLGWCDNEPRTRYPGIAKAISPVEASEQTGQPRWSRFALRLMDRAPDRLGVLKQLAAQFSPVHWVGSDAVNQESNTTLLEALIDHSDPAVREFVAQEKIRRFETAKAAKKAERIMQREADERFEW